MKEIKKKQKSNHKIDSRQLPTSWRRKGRKGKEKERNKESKRERKEDNNVFIR